MTTSHFIGAAEPRASRRERWLYALKPASWPKLFVPMGLGQCLGVAATGSVSGGAALFGAVFTLLDLVFIVLINDWADRDVDALKRRMFPHGCSPKTIPDGILPARHVLLVGLGAGALAVVLGFAAATALGRPLLGWAALGCVGLFVGYSLPPLAANYRGGGELFEMLGVGVALPWLGAYAQSGALVPGSVELLAGFAALCLASAIASGLGDEQSDRAGGKHTLVTEAGNRCARQAIELCMLAGIVLWLGLPLFTELSPLVAVPAGGIVFFHFVRVRRASSAAVTNAFGAQARYKRELHRAAWWGAGVLALAALAGRFWVI